MQPYAKNIRATPNPNGKGHQISYEIGDSRKVHYFTEPNLDREKQPHGAGSFHDPEQHQTLMERVESYLKKAGS